METEVGSSMNINSNDISLVYSLSESDEQNSDELLKWGTTT